MCAEGNTPRPRSRAARRYPSEYFNADYGEPLGLAKEVRALLTRSATRRIKTQSNVRWSEFADPAARG